MSALPQTQISANPEAIPQSVQPKCPKVKAAEIVGLYRQESLTRVTAESRLVGLGCTQAQVSKYLETSTTSNAKPAQGKRTLIMERASEVTPEQIEWLWKNTIAFGKLNAFVGNPGEGKSLATIDVAARASKGKSFPNSDEQHEPIETILFNLEDDPSDTIVPRLIAADADLTKIHIVKHVETNSEKQREEKQFSLDTDLPLLLDAIKQHPKARIVVIDPLTNHLGDVDPFNDKELRPVLSKLAVVARDHGLAIILVTHLNKNSAAQSIHRISGGVSVVAVVRLAWAFVNNEQSGKRMMLNAKSNLTARNFGTEFKIAPITITTVNGPIETVKVDWKKPILESFTKALSDIEDPEKRKTIEVKDWLEKFLSGGAKRMLEVMEAGQAEGYTEWQIKRAAEKLDVKKNKLTGKMAGHWMWSLENFDDREMFDPTVTKSSVQAQ